MITVKKLQKMIDKFGPTELDKLCSWFPQETKESIKDIVNQSQELLYENGIIKINKPSIVDWANFTYDELQQKIDDYNEKTRDKFKNENVSDIKDLQINAILKFLSEKYDLEVFEKTNIVDIYIQTNKVNGFKSYCVVTKMLNEKVFTLLDGLFDDEVANIFFIEIDYKFKMSTLKEFNLRPCNAIIKKYIKTSQLKEFPVNILKIIEKIGE